MSIEQIALMISALGIGAVLNSVVKAITEKRKVGADTTSVLTAAALTLVEPLRKELEAERVERAREHQTHLEELASERRSASALRADLSSALDECHELRAELVEARAELVALRAQIADS